MYYIKRKDLNKKINKIHYLLFGSKNKISKDIKLSNKKTYYSYSMLMTRSERKKLIAECIVKAFGFDSLKNYTKNTRYLINIKKMRPYETLSHHELRNISDKIQENIFLVLNIQINHYLKFQWLFIEELDGRVYTIKHSYKNNQNNAKHQNLINGVVSFYNKKTRYSIPEYGDILFKDSDIDNDLLSIFIDKVFYYSNLKLLNDTQNKLKNIKKPFSYKNIINDYRVNGGVKNINFIKKIKYSFDLFNIKNDLFRLNKSDLVILMITLSEYKRYDLVHLINELCGNPYNEPYHNFLIDFKRIFYCHNKKTFVKNEENILKYKAFLVEKYDFYDKINHSN